jgi:hypothetical protein
VPMSGQTAKSCLFLNCAIGPPSINIDAMYEPIAGSHGLPTGAFAQQGASGAMRMS